MIKNLPKALDWINRSFLSDKMKSAYIEILEKKYKQIGLIE
jgi:serine/threonine-protein kinase HipA